jgi:hypothetical protein
MQRICTAATKEARLLSYARNTFRFFFGGITTCIPAPFAFSTISCDDIIQVKRKGQTATQWVASTPVMPMRKAKSTRNDPDGKCIAPILGAPLALRLMVSRLY